jgi:hypothetical protein
MKGRSEKLKKFYRLEVINTINLSGQISVMLASDSQFFLYGIYNIIKSRSDNIKVTTEVSKQNIKRCLIEVKPQFLLLDNRLFRLNVHNLLSFILKNCPGTKVILLSCCTQYESNLPNTIYINRDTNSSEVLGIINRETSCKDEENGAKKSSGRDFLTYSKRRQLHV